MHETIENSKCVSSFKVNRKKKRKLCPGFGETRKKKSNSFRTLTWFHFVDGLNRRFSLIFVFSGMKTFVPWQRNQREDWNKYKCAWKFQIRKPSKCLLWIETLTIKCAIPGNYDKMTFVVLFKKQSSVLRFHYIYQLGAAMNSIRTARIV